MLYYSVEMMCIIYQMTADFSLLLRSRSMSLTYYFTSIIDTSIIISGIWDTHRLNSTLLANRDSFCSKSNEGKDWVAMRY